MKRTLEFMDFSLRWSLPIGKRISQAAGVVLVLALMVGVASATSTAKSTTKRAQVTKTRSTSHHHSGKSKKRSASRSHGQRGIDEQRILEIQNALMREHYLS